MLHLLFVTMASLGSLTLLTFLVLFALYFIKKHRKRLQQKKDLLSNHDEMQIFKSNTTQLELIAQKLDLKLKTDKMYTNPDLSINDLATEIGTNRSYISSTINQFFNKNFCSYINQYRFQELEDTLLGNKDYSHKELAMKCGFGSTDSMKRTVKLITGLSFREWRIVFANGENSNTSAN